MSEHAQAISFNGAGEKLVSRVMPKVTSKEGSGSRSTHGCWTCRLRRKKCDETEPGCVICTDRGLKCAGYEAVKPAWMDGGARQEAVHQEIKATVASVTRMKRMMKLVQSRERPSLGQRTPSISSDLSEKGKEAFYLQGNYSNYSSSNTSRATSVGQEPLRESNSSHEFSRQTTQQWSFGSAVQWDAGQNINALPNFSSSDVGMYQNQYEVVNTEDDFSNQNVALENFNHQIQPVVDGSCRFHQFYTIESETFAPFIDNSPKGISYTHVPQPSVFPPPSPLQSLPGPKGIEIPRRQSTTAERRGRASGEASIHVPLSPVSEIAAKWPIKTSSHKFTPIAPKITSPRPFHQATIGSLELSATKRSWGGVSDAVPYPIIDPREQLLRSEIAPLARLQSLLQDSKNSERHLHLREAIPLVLKIRDEFLAEYESSTDRVLSDIELTSLSNSIRVVLWADIITRTFGDCEIKSPFRGHISKLLGVTLPTQAPCLSPGEDWIFIGIESVTRLDQMRTQLMREGLFNMEGFQHHEADVLANLEYRLGSRSNFVFDSAAGAKTALRHSIFLHTIKIYFHIVVQGPFSEVPEIGNNVEIVLSNLVELNDPHTLATEFCWPFLIASSMARLEFHPMIFDLFTNTNNSISFSNHRFGGLFQIVQECWNLRAQGIHTDWRIARLNLERMGYKVDTDCW